MSKGVFDDCATSCPKCRWTITVDRTYVSQLENGRESRTVDMLFRIWAVLGMKASELIAHVERGLLPRRKELLYRSSRTGPRTNSIPMGSASYLYGAATF